MSGPTTPTIILCRTQMGENVGTAARAILTMCVATAAASTVGLSAVIESDGTIVDQLPWFEAGAMVEDVPLSSAVTPAAAFGRHIEWFVSLLALSILVMAAFASRGARG